MQFAPANAPPKIAKEYVFANARNELNNDSQQVTTAMRQAGFSSSVDRLRIQEMSVFKRTIPVKSPARRIAAERYLQAEPAAQIAHLFFPNAKANAKKTKELFFANAKKSQT